MLALKILGSSSRGNCFVLNDNSEQLMLDCGLSYNKIYNNFDKEKLLGVLISHQHT